MINFDAQDRLFGGQIRAHPLLGVVGVEERGQNRRLQVELDRFRGRLLGRNVVAQRIMQRLISGANPLELLGRLLRLKAADQAVVAAFQVTEIEVLA